MLTSPWSFYKKHVSVNSRQTKAENALKISALYFRKAEERVAHSHTVKEDKDRSDKMEDIKVQATDNVCLALERKWI